MSTISNHKLKVGPLKINLDIESIHIFFEMDTESDFIRENLVLEVNVQLRSEDDSHIKPLYHRILGILIIG